MKSLWKGLTSKAKSDLRKRLYGVIIALVLFIGSAILLLSQFSSIAWFSNNGSANASGMQVAVSTESYELYVKRDAPKEFERKDDDDQYIYPGIDLLVNQSNGALATNGYSLSATGNYNGASRKKSWVM